MRPRKSTIHNVIRVVLLAGGATLVVGIVVFASALTAWSTRWDHELATLVATDPSISAPGDGSHAIVFTREQVLLPGQVADLGGLQVTLLETRRERLEIEDQVDFGHAGHWSVHFLLENVSDAVMYGIHPVVDSQMQYLIDGAMIWEPSRMQDCTPPIEQVASQGIEPGVPVSCTLIYLVPVDGRDLYWVYATHMTRADYQEVYAAYQVFPP